MAIVFAALMVARIVVTELHLGLYRRAGFNIDRMGPSYIWEVVVFLTCMVYIIWYIWLR